MNDTALKIGTGGKVKLRSVEVAQQAEADSWALADAIYEDVSDLMEANDLDQSRSDKVKTGLYEVEDEIHEAMDKVGLDIKRGYVHDLYVTRYAWPPEDRVSQASFTAHYLLRSKTYDGSRKARLESLLSRSQKGHVTAHQVKVWISESKPRQQWTFLQLVDKRVRSALKAAAQPWHLVAQDDREEIARLLRGIAIEVEDGTFPKKVKA